MKIKILHFILIIAVPFYCSCNTLRPVDKKYWKDLKNQQNQTDEIFITLKKGQIYKFYWEKFNLTNNSISREGYLLKGFDEIPYKGGLAIQDIRVIKTEKFDIGTTIVFVTMLSVIGVLFLLISAESLKNIGSGI